MVLALFLFSCSSENQPETAFASNQKDSSANEKSEVNSVTTNSCELTNLSEQFDINFHISRYSDERAIYDSCLIKLMIADKQTKKKTDSTELMSLFLFRDTYSYCDSVTSFSTNYNNNRTVVDNYFGDIVVADFNFDNKDDIAFITEIGGNGGPLYSYYLQADNKKFYIDKYLTDSVTYFPQIIDKNRHSLTTRVHAGACCTGVHVYQFNKSTRMWRQLSHKIDSINILAKQQ
jgi:hypothetical protein